jgi:hypothetical protein
MNKNKMENRKFKKKTKNFQVYMQCSFSLNNLGVVLNLQSWSWGLRCCSVVVSSKGIHKVEQNYTLTHTHKKSPTKCPKFKCNTVSVSFSACRCNSVVLSSKVGRKRKKKSLETILRVVSATVACLPAALSL